MLTRMRCRGIFGAGKYILRFRADRLRFDLFLKLVTMNDKNAEIRVAIVSFRAAVVSLIGI